MANMLDELFGDEANELDQQGLLRRKKAMGFVEAKCPVCAKRIQVPSDEAKPYCPYCGSRFLKAAALAFAGAAAVEGGEGPSNPSGFVVEGNTLVEYRGTDAEVCIPEGITHIERHAFEGNRSIVSVTMPDTVSSIGAKAFSRCTSLRSVRFSESLVSIGFEGFYGCASLKEATVPKAVRRLDDRCFANCSSIDVIRYPAGASCGTGVFGNNPAKLVRA